MRAGVAGHRAGSAVTSGSGLQRPSEASAIGRTSKVHRQVEGANREDRQPRFPGEGRRQNTASIEPHDQAAMSRLEVLEVRLGRLHARTYFFLLKVARPAHVAVFSTPPSQMENRLLRMHLGYPVDAESALGNLRSASGREERPVSDRGDSDREPARQEYGDADSVSEPDGSRERPASAEESKAWSSPRPPIEPGASAAKNAPSGSRAVHFDDDTLETLEYELDDLATFDDDFEGNV